MLDVVWIYSGDPVNNRRIVWYSAWRNCLNNKISIIVYSTILFAERTTPRPVPKIPKKAPHSSTTGSAASIEQKYYLNTKTSRKKRRDSILKSIAPSEKETLDDDNGDDESCKLPFQVAEFLRYAISCIRCKAWENFSSCRSFRLCQLSVVSCCFLAHHCSGRFF